MSEVFYGSPGKDLEVMHAEEYEIETEIEIEGQRESTHNHRYKNSPQEFLRTGLKVCQP